MILNPDISLYMTVKKQVSYCDLAVEILSEMDKVAAKAKAVRADVTVKPGKM